MAIPTRFIESDQAVEPKEILCSVFVLVTVRTGNAVGPAILCPVEKGSIACSDWLLLKQHRSIAHR